MRLALGETHIVNENKEFMAQQGINLDAFDTRVCMLFALIVYLVFALNLSVFVFFSHSLLNTACTATNHIDACLDVIQVKERSTTVILVKNLPYETTADELRYSIGRFALLCILHSDWTRDFAGRCSASTV